MNYIVKASLSNAQCPEFGQVNEGGQFNKCGYVVYHGTVTLEELMQSNLPEQQEQGPQMGGLS